MKKKILLRCLVGAPVGLTISTLITVGISAAVGDGSFYPVVPELSVRCGSELNAVLCQTILSLFYGGVWGGLSVLWEMERWSLLRMTATHLIACSVVTFPVAFFLYWIPHNPGGALAYFGIFFAVYLGIWISRYTAMRRRIREMNRKVQG